MRKPGSSDCQAKVRRQIQEAISGGFANLFQDGVNQLSPTLQRNRKVLWGLGRSLSHQEH